MSKPQEYQTYNLYGEPMGAVRGTLLGLYGERVKSRSGIFIQAADINPEDGGASKTVYLDIFNLP